MAEILQVDRSTVSRDYQFMRDNAAEVMSKYLVETIPMEVTMFLASPNEVSDEAWRMVERADKVGHDKAKIRALYLAQRSALRVVNLQITRRS
jgi:hypothetical protein